MALRLRAFSINSNIARKWTVAVTGANGFIASRIVDLLLEKDTNVAKVIATDLISEDQYHALRERRGAPKPGAVSLEYRQADIIHKDQVLKAVASSDAVCHTCGHIDLFTDQKRGKRIYDVNVRGTENILDACKQIGISKLLYTSSVEASLQRPASWFNKPKMGPYDFGGNDYYLLEDYAASKAIAEKMVLEANNIDKNGAQADKESSPLLYSCALRPIPQYGEFDDRFSFCVSLSRAIHTPKRSVRLVWNLKPYQFSYVGNTAWAHVCALNAMLSNSFEMAGNYYFVTDDTPVQNHFETIRGFLSHFGYSYNYSIPGPLLLFFLSSYTTLNKIFGGKPVPVSFQPNVIKVVCNGFQASYDPLSRDCGYSPLYSPPEAMKRTVQYFKDNLNTLEAPKW